MNELKDNYGKPRSLYIDKLTTLTEAELHKACNQMIWLSAYAANNRRSDYHWQVTACYLECERRGKSNIYMEEFTKLKRELFGD